MNIKSKLLSSLEKVLATSDINFGETIKGSGLKGEKFNFQFSTFFQNNVNLDCYLEVNSELNENMNTYLVKDVPVNLAAYDKSDDYYISKNPGLYPDLLLKYTGEFRLINNQWRSLWFEVNIPNDAQAKDYDIIIKLISCENNDVLVEKKFTLKVLDAVLPPQKLLCTNWFHSDCLSSYYGCEPLSNEHWQLISNYMDNYREYGMNMILTPMFTPALDTVIGGERPTVQLVKINHDGNTYSFDFTLLDKFMELAESKGINYFEMAHLFTQWGAKFTPKIIVNELEKKFGWHISATSSEYKDFLNQFIPALKNHLKLEGRLDKCWFHVSDEPNDQCLDSYKDAVEIVKDLLSDCNVFDALSEYKFYEQGLVRTPVASNDFIEDFIKKDVSPLWTYYCCAQGSKNVSNRFIATPSARNRILGLQLYKFKIQGFLHWGYNFWYSFLSKEKIDPYYVTDAKEAFPGGDPFLVYPTEDGKMNKSIRQLVFNEALQDLRALELLEEYLPHDEIISKIEDEFMAEVTFTDYPKGNEFILNYRKYINKLIEMYIN